MKSLTKAEEDIMQVVWRLEKAFVREILAEFSDPKPAYNTVSTIIRILEQKGFLDHEVFGKSYRYYPVVKKEDYKKATMKSFLHKYFGDSVQEMMSFFVKEEEVDLKEMEEMMEMLRKKQNQNKNKNE